MDYKIIQIIPAPDNMYSVYTNNTGSIYEDNEEEFKCKIVCLALVEYEDGSREVVPMDISSDGIIGIIADNLKYVD